ncbi:hypothetical protein F8M41_011592 [Gigaspora margarita]|uniref:Uncharacterized protein n=1 Tax=Gigaspora margarita TaxID=4874 RepID=A0A8H3X0V9_GIGMA|nr:hypothetical protein F8M41_011592 [Gigaspora margarita]
MIPNSAQKVNLQNATRLLMQQKSEHHRLKTAINTRKTTLKQKQQTLRKNKIFKESLLQAYENITSNLTSLFGSIRSIYHSLKYIFDDDKAVVKANAQKCVQIIDDLFKQLEYISQLHSELKCNQEAIENKVDDFMDIEISDLDKDAFINLSLETIISQYYHTESLIDGLSRDLERTESYIDEMILWKVSYSHRPPPRNTS